MKYSEETLNSELCRLLAEKAEHQQLVEDLEEDIKALTDREMEASKELER